MRAAVDDVLIQGYSNAYTQYVTTPEEFTTPSSTRANDVRSPHRCPPPAGNSDALGSACARDVIWGHLARRRSTSQTCADQLPPVPSDRPVASHRFGDVLTTPHAAHRPDFEGDGAVPSEPTRNNVTSTPAAPTSTCTRADGPWVTVADDNDWSTTLRWARRAAAPTLP